MTSRSQNIAVGLTVVAAAAVLCGMIVLFAGMPERFRSGYIVTIDMPDASMLKTGDDVVFAGVTVGRISDVRFTEGDPRRGVKIKMRIEKDFPIPSSVVANVSHALMGGEAVSLRCDKPIKPGETYLPRDGSAVIRGVSSGENLVDEFRPAIQNLGDLAKTVTEMLSEPEEEALSATQGTTGPGSTTRPTSRPTLMTSLQTTLKNLNKTLLDFQTVVGDPQSQQDIKQTLANLRVVSGQAKEAMASFQAFAAEARTAVGSINQATTRASGHIDTLAAKLVGDAEGVSAVLSSLDKAIAKLGTNDGTMGKLLNDPHLYNNLVDVTNQLSSLMADFRQLTKEWREKGIPLKMK